MIITQTARNYRETFEGFGIAKARKIARQLADTRQWEADAIASGDDMAAFEHGCDAWDLEALLTREGYARLINAAA